MADPVRVRRIALEGGAGAIVLVVEDEGGAVARFLVDDERLDILADEIDDRIGGD